MLVRAAKKYSAGAKFVDADTDFSAAQQQESRKLKIACWNNAAQCQLKLGDYVAARALCGKVLDLDGLNVKALFRRGQAHTGLQDFVEAEEDLKAALGQEPDNVDVKRARKRLVQLQSAYDKKQAKAYKNMFSRMSKMEEKECKRAQRPAAEASASVPPAPASTSED
jgi:FK506-binding protein 4/5